MPWSQVPVHQGEQQAHQGLAVADAVVDADQEGGGVLFEGLDDLDLPLGVVPVQLLARLLSHVGLDGLEAVQVLGPGGEDVPGEVEVRVPLPVAAEALPG